MKKKILTAIIAGLVAVSTVTCAVPDMTVTVSAATTSTGTVNGDNVNVRQSASTSSKSLMKLNKGAKVEILSLSNGWYKIKYGNTIGYMSAQYVTKDSDGTGSKETAMDKVGYVKVDSSLNVRKSASTSAAILGKLSNGDKVNIKAQTSDKKWYKIQYNGGFGYVSADYITFTAPNKPDGKLTEAQKKQLRKEIIARAQAMVDMEWTAPCTFTSWATAKNNHFQKGKKYKGMPYTQVNQMSSPKAFTNKINAYKSENWSTTYTTRHGNTYNCPVYGNDCSGFVSFSLGLSRLDTTALADSKYTFKISVSELQPGDILDRPGWHTFMFKGWADAAKTKMVVLEQSAPAASENTKKVSDLGQYQARRLNKLA